MGAAEAPSSAGRQAAGGRSSQRRGRAALDGGSEAIRQGTRDAGTARRRLAGPVAAAGPTGDSGGVPGWGWNGALATRGNGRRWRGDLGGGSVGRRPAEPWRIWPPSG